MCCQRTTPSDHYKLYLYKTLFIKGSLWTLQKLRTAKEACETPLWARGCCPPHQGDGKLWHSIFVSSRSRKSSQWKSPEQLRQLLWAVPGLPLARKVREIPMKDISSLTQTLSRSLCAHSPAVFNSETYCACSHGSLLVFAAARLAVNACRDGASTPQPYG